MKRKLTITAGFEGVVPTGAYQNARPSFHATQEFEIEGDEKNASFVIDTVQGELFNLCYEKFKGIEQQLIVDRIQRERQDFRFYETEKGEKYPSVTSILYYDKDMFLPEHELQQHASVGNITHARVKHFIENGKWVEPKEIKEIWPDIVIVTKGGLNLSLECGDFPGFLEKYPIKDMKNGESVFNHEIKYAGTPDFIGIPAGDSWEKIGAKPIKTLFDVKKHSNEEDNFQQTFAYAECLGINQVGVIVLNNDTKQGFSKPLISDKKNYYMTLFKSKREAFKKRFGI